MWTLNDDTSPDGVIFAGTEDEVKAKWFEVLKEGKHLKMNLYAEDPLGGQWAFNPNRNPKGWDEI